MADVVSERYARALYAVAAGEKKQKTYLDELTAVCQAFGRAPDFLKLLMTPSIAPGDKQHVLETVFAGRIQPFLLNFLLLVTEKRRIGLIRSMREAYQECFCLENAIVEVHATTARPMSEAMKEKLKDTLGAVTGKRVVLETAVDRSLLGGIVVRVGGAQFDTSLRTRLSEIAAQLADTMA